MLKNAKLYRLGCKILGSNLSGLDFVGTNRFFNFQVNTQPSWTVLCALVAKIRLGKRRIILSRNFVSLIKTFFQDVFLISVIEAKLFIQLDRRKRNFRSNVFDYYARFTKPSVQSLYKVLQSRSFQQYHNRRFQISFKAIKHTIGCEGVPGRHTWMKRRATPSANAAIVYLCSSKLNVPELSLSKICQYFAEK